MREIIGAICIGWLLGGTAMWVYFLKVKLIRNRNEWKIATGRVRRGPVGYFVTYERDPVDIAREKSHNGIWGITGEQMPSASGIWTPQFGVHGIVNTAEKAFESVNAPGNAKWKTSARVWYWATDGTITEVFE